MKQELIGLIQRIPYGMVVSYGELASQLDKQYGISTSGWLVGRMMNKLLPKDYLNGIVVPRWRVVNKQGVISALKLGQRGLDQIHLLQGEGIQVVDGKIDMHIYEYNFIG